MGQEECDPKFDAAEQGEAAAAQDTARYLRLQEDQALYTEMIEIGFRGPKYEILRAELAAYALPVMRSWLRRGLVFQYTRDQGRPLAVTEFDRDGLQDVEERIGLANETVAKALTLFHTLSNSGKGWSHDGGAALTTYFIGTCVAVFPGVFRRWHKDRVRWVKASHPRVAAVNDPTRPRPTDPADECVSTEMVKFHLKRMPTKIQEIADRVVWDASTQQEIADALGMTMRAVEGRLHRYRNEFRRREEGRER